ncbi:hypothetical protein ES705_46477 [subsurface metagenome]
MKQGNALAPYLSCFLFPFPLLFALYTLPADLFGYSLKTLVHPAGMFGYLFTGYSCDPGQKHILLPELNRIHTKLPGNNVHIALYAPMHLEVAEPAVRGTEYLVGIDHVGINFTILDFIGSGPRIGCRPADIDPVISISPGIPVVVDFQGGNLAVFGNPRFELRIESLP